MMKPVNKFLLKMLLFAMPVLIFFELIFRLGLAPVVTNSTLFDAKMRHIRQQHVEDVSLMAIGSSITLYQLKSDLITRSLNMPYYNFASWGIQVSDMRLMVKDFVDEHHPQYVILCASLGEFMSPANETYPNYFNTPRFIRENFPEFFYFKNYNSIHQIIRRKYFEYPINFDRWGGAILRVKSKDTTGKAGAARDIFPTKYTAANYIELDSLAGYFYKKGIKFIFVQAPIRESYANMPFYLQRIHAHFDKCKEIVQRRDGVYLNYYDTAVFTDRFFADQYHLQDAGAVVFTKMLLGDLKRVIR